MGEPPARGPRLLCFHGKGESAESFARRLEPLQLPAELVCVDAPHPLGDGFAWWNLPPGERSFTTPRFEGWEETLARVRQVWQDRGPFDGLLGFSQGAILLAALAATGVLRPAGGTAATEAAAEAAGGEPALPAGALLLFGSAVPGPFREAVAALASAGSPGFHALHVLGACDTVNPPEGAREVAKALGGRVLQHPGGHDLPSDSASVRAYAEFLARVASAGATLQGQDIARVLQFWFRGPGRGKHYWAGGPEQQKVLDDLISREFGPLVTQASSADRKLVDAWIEHEEGALALIILLDQFSRNIYRNTPRAFEQDKLAQQICLEGIRRGYHRLLPDDPDEAGSSQRQMFYLPLFHSEDVSLLEQGQTILESKEVRYAWGIENYTRTRIEEVKQFGRIPSRNRARGLVNSPEEVAAGYS